MLPASEDSSAAVSFGRHRFEPSTGRLWLDEKEIRLTPKAASVLRELVTRAGRPVTREELFASVWNGSAVSDDALTSCIKELRRALEDDAKSPRYIETRHRRGYRFVAPLGGDRSAAGSAGRTAAAPASASIAVLPFVDMSAGRDQDHFCEGLSEELINALTHVEGLRVAARSSSFQFGSSGVDVRVVGERLGVATLLEGSVRKTRDRLRITVQLVETASGYHRWSQRFDRRVGDVFAIQEEIAESVATSLRGELSAREKRALRRRETAAEAYDHYLRGRQLLHRVKQSDLEDARRQFERSLALDPEYAPAWAGLAAVHATLYEWWGTRREDAAGAERASLRAIELAPDLAESHVARAQAHSLAGRHSEAELEYEEAIRINPLLFEGYYEYARASFARGAIERSAELFRKAADVRREDFQSALFLGQSLEKLGRLAEARAAEREGLVRARRALALNPRDGRALSLAAHALFQAGEEALALEWSGRALELYPNELSPLLNAAALRAKAGRRDEALELLERVLARGWGKRDWMEHDPDYDGLRDDPRFQSLLIAFP